MLVDGCWLKVRLYIVKCYFAISLILRGLFNGEHWNTEGCKRKRDVVEVKKA